MPVTIKPTPEKVGQNTDSHVASLAELVAGKRDPFRRAPEKDERPILHSSFKQTNFDENPKIVRYGNGFVHGLIRAYQQDLHLTIRPDDVWTAIIAQFSYYVNAHAEELREQFVSHQGKAELVVEFNCPFYSVDVAIMARKFTCLMEEKLVDKNIRNWIIPDFSTTTDNDIAVASMVMMATMKNYFSFSAISMCGFPSVTLLGEVADWENMVQRLDLLATYGEQAAEWADHLRPILSRFVATFSDPDSDDLKDFWSKACYAQAARGSGQVPTYSGWITAFMNFDTQGILLRARSSRATIYELDGQVYHVVDQSGVPSGLAKVPVLVKAYELGVEIETTIMAGSVGATISEKYEEDSEGDGEKKIGEVLQPISGWWMWENKRRPMQ